MEDNQTSQVAKQTEIPVPKAPANAPRTNRKVLIGGIIIVLVIIFGLTFYLFNQQSKNTNLQKAADLNKAGNEAVAKGDYKTANSKYSEALQITKDSKTAAALINSLSSTGNQTGKEQEVFNAQKPTLDWAEKNFPKDPDVLLSLGYAYETAGKYPEALGFYTQATQLAPDSDNAWFHYGHVLQFLGRNDEANKAYDKAYSINPNNSLVLMVLGNRYFSQGKVQEAFNYFIKASEQPDISATIKSDALSSASSLKAREGNFQNLNEALSLSEEAIKKDPNFSPALSAHGYNLYKVGKAEEGISYLKQAVDANPRITKNYYRMGLIYREQKKYTDSINYFQEGITRSNNDNTLLGEISSAKGAGMYELAKSYNLVGTNTNVLSLLKDALKLNPIYTLFLKMDFQQNGYFKEFSANPEFLDLIKT